MPEGYNIVNTNGVPVDVVTDGGINYLATQTTVDVQVDELLGFDDFASTFFTITTAGSATDTVRFQIIDLSIDVTSTLTGTEAGDVEKTAILVANDLNADGTFSPKFTARSLYGVVFINSDDQGEEGDHGDADDLQVTATGTTAVSIDTGFDKIIRRSKKVLGEADITDPRYIRLGIHGEVGSRTKAEHPINICVRKSLATTNATVFVDETVPASTVWYLINCGGADDVGGEFNTWKGFERDKVETFDGDASSDQTFTLANAAIQASDYVKLEVNDGGWTEWTMGTDYDVQDHPTDYTKSQIVCGNPSKKPPIGSDNIRVTYDSVQRVQGFFVQASDSHEGEMNAPLKLTATEFVIVTVNNKSANAAVVIANLTGYYEEIK